MDGLRTSKLRQLENNSNDIKDETTKQIEDEP